jgi:hypothetical protein
MATIRVSDLPRTTSISNQEAFDQAVSSSVLRAIDARQQQDIRGGIRLTDIIILVGGILGEPFSV